MLVLPIVLVLSVNVFSQNNNRSFYFWKLHTLSGEVILNGHYREQERIGPGINEYQKSTYIAGGVLLKTTSSILHPDFLTLDIEAGYVPESSRNNYIVMPDQAEVRTLKKLGGITATFFRQKNITFNIFGNYDERYFSRENLTDIKSSQKELGYALNYNNKYLPLTVEFRSKKWEETEVQTSRKYKLDQNLFSARLHKSFTKSDKNELRYSHDNNLSINQNLYRVANTIDNIEFTSHINLDTKQKYSLHSMVSSFNQYGNLTMKRFQVNESVNFHLPLHLSFSGSYNFYDIRQNINKLEQHNVNSSLEHKLFESLLTRLNFDYNIVNHDLFQESNTKSGVEFNYTKIIPHGQLLVSYRFDRYHQNFISDPLAINISNEQYTISDSKIILLRLPDVKTSTVIIKDATGTIIYQIGLDYILIERNQYVEIRRIPGGAITNNSLVFADYTATQPGNYSYDANTHSLNSSIYLLNNILSFYYKFSTQDYLNIEKAEFVTLNYFTQNVAGCRLDFEFINAGMEYEYYKSSIVPYKMIRYYMNFQRYLGKKIVLMLNGNIQDYTMLDEPESKYQKYMDVTGKITYSFLRQTNLNVDLMYRKQTGRGIDLDLLTGKAEITSSINRLYVTLGLELYRRNYIGEQINFKGTYIKIVRKF